MTDIFRIARVRLMNRYATLLKQIDAFNARHGMSDTAFGLAAVNDSKIVPRIRSGKNITFRTFDRLTEFMAQKDAA